MRHKVGIVTRIRICERVRKCVRSRRVWESLGVPSRGAASPIQMRKTARSLLRRRQKVPRSDSSFHSVPTWRGFVRELFRKTRRSLRARLAVRVFEEWRAQRNNATSDSGEQCPASLQRPIGASLNYWLSRFVTEARREDGQTYPGLEP